MLNPSNYPSGFANGVSIRGLPVLSAYAGKIVWVDSVNGSNGNKGTFDRPLASITKALTFCTASRGDIIVLKPKHAETITAAGGIDVNIAGVAVVGIGVGAQRPTITYTTANTATMLVSAADVVLDNMLFRANFLSIAAAIDTSKTDTKFHNLSFVDTDSTHNFLTPIKVTSTSNNVADGLNVIGCRWNAAAAGALEFIEVNGNLDRLIARENFICSVGTASPLILSAGTKVLTNADICWNRLQNANTSGDIFINNGGSANTGLVAYNIAGNLDVTGAQDFGAATGLQFFENYVTSTSTEAGALAQAADTPLT